MSCLFTYVLQKSKPEVLYTIPLWSFILSTLRWGLRVKRLFVSVLLCSLVHDFHFASTFQQLSNVCCLNGGA